MSNYRRLTMRNNNIIDTNCKNCKQCKKVGRKYICDDMTACDEEIINRLAELEDKIENGTLVELPCQIGDIVYQTDGERIYELMILDILIRNGKPYYETDTIDFDERAFGVSIFLTKPEAEAKLKELKGEV